MDEWGWEEWVAAALMVVVLGGLTVGYIVKGH